MQNPPKAPNQAQKLTRDRSFEEPKSQKRTGGHAGAGDVPDGVTSAALKNAKPVQTDSHGWREGFCNYQQLSTPVGIIGTLGGLDAPPNMATGSGSKARNESLRANPFQKPQSGAEWDSLKGQAETTDSAQRRSGGK
jgi:hypothetical protein